MNALVLVILIRLTEADVESEASRRIASRGGASYRIGECMSKGVSRANEASTASLRVVLGTAALVRT